MYSNEHSELEHHPTQLTGQKLRSYAFALLTRRDYSKAELKEKLIKYANDAEEVNQLINELELNQYQSDERVAQLTLNSQLRKGKGPNRIKMALKAKQVETDLIRENMKEIDWLEQAYQLKIKKFGEKIETDPKLKAKQIRFLQYRGFEMDVIMKVIKKSVDE